MKAMVYLFCLVGALINKDNQCQGFGISTGIPTFSTVSATNESPSSTNNLTNGSTYTPGTGYTGTPTSVPGYTGTPTSVPGTPTTSTTTTPRPVFPSWGKDIARNFPSSLQTSGPDSTTMTNEESSQEQKIPFKWSKDIKSEARFSGIGQTNVPASTGPSTEVTASTGPSTEVPASTPEQKFPFFKK